ncbi:DUF192 domain-containing protein [Geomonas sp.]|uniref:DUF192 domain-containing protein n=1 Tax=Geomonas sp. TaxID=2651584 RepID=UPI002B4A3964|nr:DUF192 domain-containing protein [Geomonas sp.]HJV35011.1 DUF192 domain-containing protein [Geomonas sp.]
MKAINGRSGRPLATQLFVAATFLSRSRGLLGRQGLSAGEGLLITPCNGVHTFFMRFPIDVLFLNGENRVIRTGEHLQPNRISALLFSCKKVIELPAGAVSQSGTVTGDQILLG